MKLCCLYLKLLKSKKNQKQQKTRQNYFACTLMQKNKTEATKASPKLLRLHFELHCLHLKPWNAKKQKQQKSRQNYFACTLNFVACILNLEMRKTETTNDSPKLFRGAAKAVPTSVHQMIVSSITAILLLLLLPPRSMPPGLNNQSTNNQTS